MELTVSANLAVAVKVPEVPVRVTFDVPGVAELLAVKVSTLDPVVGFVPNTALTPVGSPDIANVTFPVKPPVSMTAMVSVVLAPWVRDTDEAEVARVKPGVCVVLTVREMLALAVSEPDVPVIVSVDVPAAAALLAVRVSTLEPVVGLVPNAAVTPEGSPETASVTLPVNPPAGRMVTVSVVLLPWTTVSAEVMGAMVKLGVAVPGMVSAMVTEWLIVPSVPVRVTVLVPAAVPDWTKKLTLTVPVALTEFGEKLAWTPEGRLLALSDTLPVSPPT